MGSDLGDVKRLLDAFEKSDWESVHLRIGDLDVAISTQADAAAATVPAASAPRPAQVPTSDAPVTPPAASPPAPPGPALAGTPILAPSPGIFWRSPAPGEPPFVGVGQEIDSDTTVCILELMKLMNNVHAGVTGVVTAILVGNGEAIAIGQPLMTVLETPAEMLVAQ